MWAVIAIWKLLPWYLAGLVGLLLVARRRTPLLAAIVLSVNWAACTFVMPAIAPSWPVWARAAPVDWWSGRLLVGRGKLGAALAISFALEGAMHVALMLAGKSMAAAWAYWWATFVVAWGQAIFLAFWGAHDGGGKRSKDRHTGQRRPLGERMAGDLRSALAPGWQRDRR